MDGQFVPDSLPIKPGDEVKDLQGHIYLIEWIDDNMFWAERKDIEPGFSDGIFGFQQEDGSYSLNKYPFP